MGGVQFYMRMKTSLYQRKLKNSLFISYHRVSETFKVNKS